MNKVVIAIPATALIFGIVSCAELDQRITDCDNLREEIVELSEEDRQSRGFALVKIREPKTLYKSDKKVSCSGSAIWTDGDKTSITYESYIDEDGDRMIEYEVN
tara:strand:- start:25 stop:336 length:312 start_codon:yes stop_codon:yes gene_type:complete